MQAASQRRPLFTEDSPQGEWVHFQGKQLCHFHCCLPFKLESSHKGKRICFHQSQLFPLRIHPILEKLHSPGKQTGSNENCLLLMEVYPYTLQYYGTPPCCLAPFYIEKQLLLLPVGLPGEQSLPPKMRYTPKRKNLLSRKQILFFMI